MTHPDARDVIARAISPVEWDSPGKWPTPDDVVLERRAALFDRADTILAALHEAGFAVVRKPDICYQYGDIVPGNYPQLNRVPCQEEDQP